MGGSGEVLKLLNKISFFQILARSFQEASQRALLKVKLSISEQILARSSQEASQRAI